MKSDPTEKILIEGDAIQIKRTNGTLQTAIVSSIDYESCCVKVEWLDQQETKGKEIHFSNVTLLNPGFVLVKPVNNSESIDEEVNPRRNTRAQTARVAASQKSSDQNMSVCLTSEKFQVRGRGCYTTRATKSVIETVSKSKEGGGLKKANKIEQDRNARRKKQAQVLAERQDFLKKNVNNPHWQLLGMIEDFRKQIEFKPLNNHDAIEDHLITVAVRKRPLNDIELSKKEIDIITIPSKNQLFVHEPKLKVDLTKYLENHIFKFDYALNENCTNEVVYKYTAQPLIRTVFNGGFATCFAYGQTGSGKTYTMSGRYESKSDKGIYALTANDIFKNVNAPKYRHHNFIVSCSFFEIYTKKVYDLLNRKKQLRILEDGQREVQVVGLTEKLVASVNDVLELIFEGNEARASGKTSVNAQSSRSHAIFQFYLRSQVNPKVVYGKFSLIDLAGNERGADTFSSSKITRQEGSEINTSLLSLKECIRALGRKGAHLPFRGSKLTQVLRDSFVGANSKTCMIAMISPGVSSCENTLNTLRYADRVKELGGGDISSQRVEQSREVTAPLETTIQTQTPDVIGLAQDENLVRQNLELVKSLQKYYNQAEGLLNVMDRDLETYYVNLNIVVTDAITSLTKIRNLLNYFGVLTLYFVLAPDIIECLMFFPYLLLGSHFKYFHFFCINMKINLRVKHD
ncbi:kinesin-like protein Klp10A [Anthonomus grandis grandis]|uniref:kinesin-like protein Klp10A n=1 Tax=Anthonomus grandis grandis TaxID=2921223 RepID=UPI00216505A2|nr:kinesin-like protein Klp10A [Anthonomus grandis grandis]